MNVYTPEKAAIWLTEKIGRKVSRLSVQIYIQSGDLAATNLSSGQKQARWVLVESDLEAFAERAQAEGKLPVPKGGWPNSYTPKGPDNDNRRKKIKGLVAFAN